MAETTSDEILMAAYQAGNRAAFGELFARHGGSVYGFLARRLPDRSLADDLYQEAFLRLHRARATYDSRRPFRAWLFGIVHNLVTDAYRSRGRAPETVGDAPVERGSEAPSPERVVTARETAATLQEAIAQLSDDEATALVLARVEGLDYDEIGGVLGRSAAATKQLAYRALKRVRAMMATRGREEES